MNDMEIAKKAVSAMIIRGIEVITEKIDGKDFDHCNRVLCMALHSALELQLRVGKVKEHE